MPEVREGVHDASGKKVAIIAGRFNDVVTAPLVDGAIECFGRHGAADSDVVVYWVPGAFELPQLTRELALNGGVDGVVFVGAIIRGETNHFDVLCQSVIDSIARASEASQIPVTYGVVSAENLNQAMDRAGGKHGNKGWDSALALIEMMTLWKSGGVSG